MSRETTLHPLKIEPGEVVHRNRNVEIRRVVARFDGFEKEYFVSDYGQRAAIVVMDRGQVLLVRQYRLIVNEVALEIPGGRVDAGESPEQAAARECLEETGIRCSGLSELIRYQLGLDTAENPTHIFFTETFEKAMEMDPASYTWLPIEECIEMIFSGKIQDSLTILALLAYRERHPATGGARHGG